MWLSPEDISPTATFNEFLSYKASNQSDVCIKVKYWLSAITTPRYHYCIYCPSHYTGAPYDKDTGKLDQIITLKNLKLPVSDDLLIKNGYAGWSNGKGKAIFKKTQNTDIDDAKMIG